MFDEPEELAAFIEEHGGYWDGECNTATVEDWKHEVLEDCTRLSYWEWAHDRMEQQEGN